MATAYTDGTKLSIEMALVANALGLRTTVPGMHGPRSEKVQDVFKLFDFPALWADRQPSVDYILGAEPGGGVYAIGYCDHPYQQDMPRTTRWDAIVPSFYRPCHLCHVEALNASLTRC
jgi:predicted homoserine dehydrogenase-like protein